MIRNGERKIKPHHAAETTAFRAGAHRGVETEKRRVGGVKRLVAVRAHKPRGIAALDGTGFGHNTHRKAPGVAALPLRERFFHGFTAAGIGDFSRLKAVGRHRKIRAVFGLYFVFNVRKALGV